MSRRDVYLAVAPNILRKTAQDLGRLFPSLELIPPQTHAEMQEFATRFGQDEIPALSVAAYPQFVHNILRLQEQGLFARMPESLPPMRRELTAIGLGEPSPYLRVVTAVPFVIASRADLAPPITDWADLCREDICHHVAVPPHDTPLPDLFDTVMGATCGEAAQTVMENKNTSYTPLDINKHVDAGTFKAGVTIPAFSKTFRNNGGKMVWPKSGAWVVPIVACIHKNAAPEVYNFLDYMLSMEYQCYVSENGYTVPVIQGVPWFAEMQAADGKLFWPGWDVLSQLGQLAQLAQLAQLGSPVPCASPA